MGQLPDYGLRSFLNKPSFKFSKDSLGIAISMITNLEYRCLSVSTINRTTIGTRLDTGNYD